MCAGHLSTSTTHPGPSALANPPRQITLPGLSPNPSRQIQPSVPDTTHHARYSHAAVYEFTAILQTNADLGAPRHQHIEEAVHSAGEARVGEYNRLQLRSDDVLLLQHVHDPGDVEHLLKLCPLSLQATLLHEWHICDE